VKNKSLEENEFWSWTQIEAREKWSSACARGPNKARGKSDPVRRQVKLMSRTTKLKILSENLTDGWEWTGEWNRGQMPAEAKQAVGTSTEKSSEHNTLTTEKLGSWQLSEEKRTTQYKSKIFSP
jgi:hypothetical protein